MYSKSPRDLSVIARIIQKMYRNYYKETLQLFHFGHFENVQISKPGRLSSKYCFTKMGSQHNAVNAKKIILG